MGKAFLESRTVANVVAEVARGAAAAAAAAVDARVDSTVGEVLELMKKKDASLAAVYEEGPDKTKHYKGVVDVYDLVGYLSVQSELSSKPESLSPEFLNHGLRSVFETGGQPGSKLQLRAAKMVKQSESLYTAVALLSGSPSRHRVLVSENGSLEAAQNGQGAPVCVLTADAVLQYLYAHLDLLSENVSERPVRNGVMNRVITARADEDFVKVHHCKPFTVNLNATSLLAFKSMWAHKVGAIGIVDDNHVLVDVISSTDLRSITSESLSDLHSPAVAFVRHADRRRPSEPLTCLPTTTLSHAMARLIRTKCHRLFVVDDAHRPLGVVSVSDVISAFLD